MGFPEMAVSRTTVEAVGVGTGLALLGVAFCVGRRVGSTKQTNGPLFREGVTTQPLEQETQAKDEVPVDPLSLTRPKPLPSKHLPEASGPFLARQPSFDNRYQGENEASLFKDLEEGALATISGDACRILSRTDDKCAFRYFDAEGRNVQASLAKSIIASLSDPSNVQAGFFLHEHREGNAQSDSSAHNQLSTRIYVPFGTSESFLGLLEVVRTTDEREPFSSVEVKLLTAYAYVCSVSLRNFQQSKRRVKSLLFTIIEMAEQVMPITSKEALLWKLTHAASTLLSTDSVTILVEDSDRKDYLIGEDLSGKRLEVCTQETSIWAEVFVSGEPVISNNLRHDEHCDVSEDTSEGFETPNVMCLPIPSSSTTESKVGNICGVIQVTSSTGHFSEMDLFLLKGFVSVASSALSNSRLYKQLSISSYGSHLVEQYGSSLVLPEANSPLSTTKSPLSVSSADRTIHPTRLTDDTGSGKDPSEKGRRPSQMNRRHSGMVGETTKSAPQIARTQNDDSLQSNVEDSRNPRKSIQVVGDFCCLPSTKDEEDEQAKQDEARDQHEHMVQNRFMNLDRACSKEVQLCSPLVVDGEVDYEFDVDKLGEKGMPLLDWNFDVLSYNMAELIDLVVLAFESFDIPTQFLIPRITLQRFVKKVLSMYNETPFHNYHHAAHVFQNTFKMVTVEESLKNQMTLLDVFALFVAALCHDMDHNGTNNTYHINTWSRLSLRYNDISVLEQHHASLTFKVALAKETNILQTFTARSRSKLRKIICSAILATDMNNHQKNLQMSLQVWRFEKMDLDHRTLLVGMILHSADLSNPGLDFTQAKEWERRISEEFRWQVALEKRNGLPVAPFMADQSEHKRVLNEIHFLEAFALPQWQAAVDRFPSWMPRLVNCKENQKRFLNMNKLFTKSKNQQQGTPGKLQTAESSSNLQGQARIQRISSCPDFLKAE